MLAPAGGDSQKCTIKCNWRTELEHKFNSFSVGKLFRYGCVKISIAKGCSTEPSNLIVCRAILGCFNRVDASDNNNTTTDSVIMTCLLF